MTLKQAGKSEPAEMGQILRVAHIGECFGFCRAEIKGSPLFFVEVPYKTKLRICDSGTEVEFCRVNSIFSEDYDAVIFLQTEEWIKLSDIDPSLTLIVIQIPSDTSSSSKLAGESTEETGDANTKVSHLNHLVENIDPIACE
jgi:hypothetical protein